MISLRVVAPSPPLREFVQAYVLRAERLGLATVVSPVTARFDVILAFHFDQPSEAYEYRTGQTRVLPTPLLIGPQTRRLADLHLRGDRASLLVHFQPGAFHRLFHLPTPIVTDTAVDARDVLGHAAEVLFQQLSAARTVEARVSLVEAYLSAHLPRAAARHSATDAARTIRERHGRVRLPDLVTRTGLSERQFERRFVEQMGIGPKLYARVVRLNFAQHLKRTQPALTWARVSQEAGYFDQTHLVKDFKALTGALPTHAAAPVPLLDSLGAD